MDSSWTPGEAQGSTRENKLIKKYYEKKGGLVVTEVNVTDGIKDSRQRRLDAVRFPGEKDRIIEYSDIGREKVSDLFESEEAELIEVHNWGFYVFGQLVGKEEVLKENWRLKETRKVLLVDNGASGGSYKSQFSRDEATHEIFDKYNIEVISF